HKVQRRIDRQKSNCQMVDHHHQHSKPLDLIPTHPAITCFTHSYKAVKPISAPTTKPVIKAVNTKTPTVPTMHDTKLGFFTRPNIRNILAPHFLVQQYKLMLSLLSLNHFLLTPCIPQALIFHTENIPGIHYNGHDQDHRRAEHTDGRQMKQLPAHDRQKCHERKHQSTQPIQLGHFLSQKQFGLQTRSNTLNHTA